MSEYDDYSEKLFHQSQQNSLRDDSNYDAEYIDFNPAFSFNLCQVDNSQFQNKHFQEKQQNDADTNYTLRPKQYFQMEDISVNKIRVIRRIDTNAKIQNSYLKAKRGSAKQTMQLNINFKTIFCKVIRDLIDMRLLKKSEKELFLKYKSESPSFKSLANFLDTPENLESKQKLKQLMSTSSILVKIEQSDLRMDNKMVMLKFLQVMRVTVKQGNNEKKWKKVST